MSKLIEKINNYQRESVLYTDLTNLDTIKSWFTI